MMLTIEDIASENSFITKNHTYGEDESWIRDLKTYNV